MRRHGFFVAFVLSSLVALGCTGDDPRLTSSESAADGGPNGEGGPGGGEDAGPTSSSLKIEGQRLVLVTGTSNVLQFKVTERVNVGEVSFKLAGIPEGVTAPGVVKLAADADTINIDVSAAGVARHGDFVVTLEAEGRPVTATAALVVRGGAGSVDTGFGQDGSVLVKAAGGEQHVIGLTDDRIVAGTTSGGKPAFKLLDIKGGETAAIVVSRTGTLVDLAPTSDGGFVSLVSAPNELRMVWYTSAGLELPTSLVVSTATTPLARLAATPQGTFFAQAKTGDGVFLGRYTVGAVDATFDATTIAATDGQGRLRFLCGHDDGSASLGMQSGMSQEQLVNVQGALITKKPLNFQETCGLGAGVGNDFVSYCTNDEPSRTLRRYKPTLDLDAAFGSAGKIPVDVSAQPQVLRGFGADRLYVITDVSGMSKTQRITARDAAGGLRTVFATNGVLDVTGADDIPYLGLDARGRLLVVSGEQTTESHIRVRRFWD